MTVLVDTARFPAHGRLWAHLASDASLAELHAFAAALGVPPGAFEGDHYDVPADLVAAAVALGAVPVTTREVLAALQRSGLRTPKRRGEKVLATTAGPGGRTDVVRARRVPAPHGVHLLLTPVDEGDDGDHDGGASQRVRADPVTDLRAGTVLGFRRRWSTGPGTTTVVHDGVVAAPGTAGTGPAGAWWSVLLPPPDRARHP